MKQLKYLFFIMLAIFITAFYGCGENLLTNPGNGNDNAGLPDNGNSGETGGGTGGSDNEGDTEGGGSEGGNGDTDGEGPIIDPPLSKIKYVLAGTSNGIYISEDNGVNWAKTSNSEGINMSAQWISVADLGNNVVLAGSGEDPASLGKDGRKGHGIIRSEDGGKTWHKTSMAEGQWNDFADLGGNSVLAASNTPDLGGVWRSDDSGKNWVKLQDNLVNSGIVLALLKSYGNSVLASKPETFLGQPSPVRISGDKGVKWQRSLEQPQAITIYKFLLLKNSQGILAAGGANAGLQYTKDLTGRIWNCTSLSGADGKAVRSLAQLKSGTVLAGLSGDQSAYQGKSSGIYRSTNGMACNSYGQTNMKSNVWYAITALDNGDALAGCGNNDGINGKCSGIWRSSDDGLNWTQINSSTIKDLYIFSMKEVRE